MHCRTDGGRPTRGVGSEVGLRELDEPAGLLRWRKIGPSGRIERHGLAAAVLYSSPPLFFSETVYCFHFLLKPFEAKKRDQNRGVWKIYFKSGFKRTFET
jgi:hypothetical protein